MKRIFLILTILILATSAFKCGNSAPIEPDYSFHEQTPKGVFVGSNFGATVAEKEAIDEGITGLITDAKALGYTQKLNFTDFNVIIRDDCTPSPESHTPSWKVWGNYPAPFGETDPATGKQFVYAAEQVIFNGETPVGGYICRGDKPLMAMTSRYYGEHQTLYFNNMPEYQRTAVHTDASNSHPLIPSASK